jgi:hypothetical protein
MIMLRIGRNLEFFTQFTSKLIHILATVIDTLLPKEANSTVILGLP